MLSAYGRNTGIAFQIADDLLDLVGDENKTGKTAGNDLEHDKPTLPLIHFFKTASAADKKVVKQILDATPGSETGTTKKKYNRSALLEKLNGCGSIAYARSRADEFTERAVVALEGFGNNAGKEALVETAKFVAGRSA